MFLRNKKNLPRPETKKISECKHLTADAKMSNSKKFIFDDGDFLPLKMSFCKIGAENVTQGGLLTGTGTSGRPFSHITNSDFDVRNHCNEFALDFSAWTPDRTLTNST